LGIREELIIVRRFLLGIGALLAIAVILVGVPIALIVVAGNPLPTSSQIHNIVTLVPDYGNVALLTKVLPCLGWVRSARESWADGPRNGSGWSKGSSTRPPPSSLQSW
jgi:hypothetical protein